MTMRFRTLTPAIGVELRDVRYDRLFTPAELEEVRAAWLRHGVMVFRGHRDATPDDLMAFSSQFGELEDHDQVQFTLPGFPKVAVVSNVKREGRYIGAPKAGRSWHSDSQYLRRPPSGSFLYAQQVPPEGGDTLFANTIAAFEALDDASRRLSRLLAVSYSRVRAYPLAHPERPPLTEEEKSKLPDVEHPLVRTHPESGCKALYVGGVQHGGRVMGMDQDESDALLAELRAFATQPRFVYAHQWEAGDAILWDNRSTLHCATPFDEERYDRLMLRTQLAGTIPI